MAIAQIIKYEGNNDILVWKHPEEDFNTTTQLIVHESQEAILFRNGQALDLFGPGRHTLETQNIPLLKKTFNRPTGGETPFSCQVYFINKVDVMDILWGTSSPIPVQDPVFDIILPVRANGQFAIRVEDSRKFIVKLVGSTSGIGKATLNAYFRGLLMTRFKDYLSKIMVDQKVTFLQIHGLLNEVSEHIQMELAEVYENYGVSIVNFFVNTINVPDNDPGYIRIRNALAAAKEKELLAKGKRAEMDIIGYNYQQERTYGVLDKAASNEGSGSNLMGAGMGIGMGVPIGGMVGKNMGDALGEIGQKNETPSKAVSEDGGNCSQCEETLPKNAKFCLNCGEKVVKERETKEINCPNCKEKTPKGKFCMNCGFKLEALCPKCGTNVPPGGKFCLECGEKLTGVNLNEK